jgi:hypothetical protein
MMRNPVELVAQVDSPCATLPNLSRITQRQVPDTQLANTVGGRMPVPADQVAVAAAGLRTADAFQSVSAVEAHP